MRGQKYKMFGHVLVLRMTHLFLCKCVSVHVYIYVGGRLFLSWGCMCPCEGLLVLPSTLMTKKKHSSSL